jgi:zinc transporter 5/7
MASTYALPMAPTSHTHAHAHSHSHERVQSQSQTNYSPYANGQTNNSSPMKGPGHQHTHSDLSEKGQLHGAVRSPYAEYNGNAQGHKHNHSHGHDRSSSNESSWTLKPFANPRPKPRPRGESDLGRTPPRKNASAAKYGFPLVSPIQEMEPVLPTPSS